MRTILSRREVLQRVPVSARTLARQVQSGKFPRPVVVSDQVRGYYEDEVERWIATRPRTGLR